MEVREGGKSHGFNPTGEPPCPAQAERDRVEQRGGMILKPKPPKNKTGLCTACIPETQWISLVVFYIFLAVRKSNENNNTLILPTQNLINLILLSDRFQPLSKTETNCCAA